MVGVCRKVGKLEAFTSKTGKELKKRDITLFDNTLVKNRRITFNQIKFHFRKLTIFLFILCSNHSVILTLWNADAVDFIDHGQPVMLVKGARISEFGGGKSITVAGSSQIERDPNLFKARFLRDWFNNGGGRDACNSISGQIGNLPSKWLTFQDAKIKILGHGDKPDYYQLKGIITLFRKTNLTYKACEKDTCNKNTLGPTVV